MDGNDDMSWGGYMSALDCQSVDATVVNNDPRIGEGVQERLEQVVQVSLPAVGRVGQDGDRETARQSLSSSRLENASQNF